MPFPYWSGCNSHVYFTECKILKIVSYEPGSFFFCCLQGLFLPMRNYNRLVLLFHQILNIINLYNYVLIYLISIPWVRIFISPSPPAISRIPEVLLQDGLRLFKLHQTAWLILLHVTGMYMLMFMKTTFIFCHIFEDDSLLSKSNNVAETTLIFHVIWK